MTKLQGKLEILKQPKVIIASMILGCLLGLYSKEYSSYLAPLGQLYMSLLSMCISPLLIMSISSSLASLFQNKSLSGRLGSIFSRFPISLLFASLLGILVALSMQIGKNLNPKAQDAIGKLIEKSSLSQATSPSSGLEGILSLFKLMIPNNIFSALSAGNNLAVLFFSILLGISLGLVQHSKTNFNIQFLEVMYEAFNKMIKGIMYGLPIGLFCMFAVNFSQVGPGILYAIWKYVLALIISSILVILIANFFMKKTTGNRWKEHFEMMKKPNLVAAATCSSMLSIPNMIASFENKKQFDKQNVNLFLPLSVCLNPVAGSILVSTTALFMMNLYSIAITPSNLLIVLIGSVFTALAQSGAPGLSGLSMYSIVLAPLGVPLEPSILIVMASLPLADSFLTLANVNANMTIVARISKQSESNSIVQHHSVQSSEKELSHFA